MSRFEIILSSFNLSKRNKRRVKKQIQREEHNDKKTNTKEQNDSKKDGFIKF